MFGILKFGIHSSGSTLGMSSRALRRLQLDATVIKVSGGAELSSEEEEDHPGFNVKTKKGRSGAAVNPFAVVSEL